MTSHLRTSRVKSIIARDYETVKFARENLEIRIESQISSYSELTIRSGFIIAACSGTLAYIFEFNTQVMNFFILLAKILLLSSLISAFFSVFPMTVNRRGLELDWIYDVIKGSRLLKQEYFEYLVDIIEKNNETISMRSELCFGSAIYLLLAWTLLIISSMHPAFKTIVSM